jgi:hypothetical protein
MSGLGELGHGSIGVVVVGFDFNLVAADEQLGAQGERFALQREIDEFNGPVHLDGGRAMGDLIGVELEVEPTDGDGFHGARSVESQLNCGNANLTANTPGISSSRLATSSWTQIGDQNPAEPMPTNEP